MNVGGGALFKLFRKLEPGRNLDAEVLAALTGSGITPAAYGVLASPDCGYDLALFLEPEVTDGWVYATAACASGRDFSTEARALGTELRELHRRLADTFGTATTNGDALSAYWPVSTLPPLGPRTGRPPARSPADLRRSQGHPTGHAADPRRLPSRSGAAPPRGAELGDHRLRRRAVEVAGGNASSIRSGAMSPGCCAASITPQRSRRAGRTRGAGLVRVRQERLPRRLRRRAGVRV